MICFLVNLKLLKEEGERTYMYGLLAAAGPSFIVHLLVALGAVVVAGIVKLVKVFRHAKS